MLPALKSSPRVSLPSSMVSSISPPFFQVSCSPSAKGSDTSQIVTSSNHTDCIDLFFLCFCEGCEGFSGEVLIENCVFNKKKLYGKPFTPFTTKPQFQYRKSRLYLCRNQTAVSSPSQNVFPIPDAIRFHRTIS
jgi:hypothetical protein